jgi:hypothetical protein
MLTVAIARPPSTYTSFLSFFAFSILEKLYSLLLHVESNRFLVLLKFLSCCYSYCCCQKERVTTVVTRVVGGSFAFLTTNQSRDKRSRDTREQVSKLLSFSHSFSLFKLSGKKKKNKNVVVVLSDIAATLRGPMRCRTSQQHVARSNALSAIAATLQRPVRCWPSQQRCDIQRVAGHRSNVATSNALLQQRRKNAASCNVLSANAATMLRAATLPAIVAALQGAAM